MFTGTDAEDEYHGRAGDDTIDGGKGGDRLYGDEGNDKLNGGDGNDILVGGSGRDVIYGGKGNDSIGGFGDRDIVYGGIGIDSITGNYSVFYGGGDSGYLTGAWCQMHGGAGNDYLEIYSAFDRTDYADGAWGDSGADTFAFLNGDQKLLRGDFVIHDLTNEDKIDLSGLDANSRIDLDQAFRLVPEFTGRAGDLTIRYDAAEDMTLIELYTDKDMTVDGTILAPGNHTDFVNLVF